MAIPQFTISKFGEGYFKVRSSTFQSTRLQEFIDKFYEENLRCIIGDEAFIEIENQATLKPKWTDLFDGVIKYKNTDCDKLLKQKGLINALVGLIYFDYVGNWFDVTDAGNVGSLQEVSQAVGGDQNAAIAVSRWNDSIRKLDNEISLFIRNYERLSRTIISSTDNGGGSYTIFISDTFYLADTDTVKISEVEFKAITNVVANTSFEISGAVLGLDFTGQEVVYEPYKDFPLFQELFLPFGKFTHLFI